MDDTLVLSSITPILSLKNQPHGIEAPNHPGTNRIDR